MTIENQSNQTILNIKQSNPQLVIRGAIVSNETSTKGGVKSSVQWLRCDEKSVKDNPAYLVTSKNYREIAAIRPAVDFASGLRWLADNSELQNVQDWITGLFDAVNKPLLAAVLDNPAVNEVSLIGDIQSLVAFSTLERARGRTASRFDSKTFDSFIEVYRPAMLRSLASRYPGKESGSYNAAVNLWVNKLRTILVNRNIGVVSQDDVKKLGEHLAEVLEYAAEKKPESEGLICQAVVYLESYGVESRTPNDDPDVEAMY